MVIIVAIATVLESIKIKSFNELEQQNLVPFISSSLMAGLFYCTFLGCPSTKNTYQVNQTNGLHLKK